MLRSSLFTAGALLLCSSAFGQTPVPPHIQQRVLPVTGPSYNIDGTLDLRTGKFTRTRNPIIGNDGQEEVYDNTCASGFYVGTEPAGVPGTGGPFPETFGDFGALPSLTYAEAENCTVGLANSYDITQFEIAWCQLAAPTTGAVIWLDFWQTPTSACITGAPPTAPPTPTGLIGGTRPPAVTTVLSATLTGLPRSNSIGTLACYFLNITLVTPGFPIDGSDNFTVTDDAGDHFGWAFTIPTTTGSDGPLLSGRNDLFTPCFPCVGTIFEVGGQTTNQGTGAGNDNTWFLEDYGGTLAGALDCYVFGGTNPPAGFHLELFATKPGGTGGPVSQPFCDTSDGSLTSCPCAPGNPETGCDSPIPPMQGGGLTGGVQLTATAQSTTPLNRATLTSAGYPSGSVPGVVCFRNNGIDPSAPVVFGDGLRCVDASASPTTFVRLGSAQATSGSATHTFGHGAMAGVGTFFYQAWFRSTPISYCDPTAAFNLSNGLTLDW